MTKTSRTHASVKPQAVVRMYKHHTYTKARRYKFFKLINKVRGNANCGLDHKQCLVRNSYHIYNFLALRFETYLKNEM